MEIKWIRLDQQLPEDDQFIILRKIGEKAVSRRIGKNVRAYTQNKHLYEWTVCTDEAWELLNDDRRRGYGL
jgi:hypothetical protein